MTPEPPARAQRRPSQTTPAEVPRNGDDVLDDIVSLLAGHLGQTTSVVPRPAARSRATRGGPKVQINIDYSDTDPRSIHLMAGQLGYSITSNWFAQWMAKLLIAGVLSRSQAGVFLFVAGGQKKGTGIASYTQQQITDGLNELASAKKITRPTVNKAVKTLIDWGWLESAGYGRIRLNVTLWFAGNSGEQKNVLEEIASDHGYEPDAFPHKVGPKDLPGQQMLDFEEAPVRGATG
ncbi:helix-turn-helix domain-containing protein [Streptomyces sp. NPDC093801]|uniref:helix-turn-helix domain-containing protein n=1 Tax=Streptomyces sp. NPDC093801 TaxID=3155203 RepID=UPI003450E340